MATCVGMATMGTFSHCIIWPVFSNIQPRCTGSVARARGSYKRLAPCLRHVKQKIVLLAARCHRRLPLHRVPPGDLQRRHRQAM